MNDIRLSPHFKLGEFLNLNKYPQNVPTMQHVVNMAYGCLMLLEPARLLIGPILINSGFRNPRVNALVGGVQNSQHLLGQAADIRPKDPAQFQRLVAFLKACEYTDQLLTASSWLHISCPRVHSSFREARVLQMKSAHGDSPPVHTLTKLVSP